MNNLIQNEESKTEIVKSYLKQMGLIDMDHWGHEYLAGDMDDINKVLKSAKYKIKQRKFVIFNNNLEELVHLIKSTLADTPMYDSFEEFMIFG